MAKGGAFERKIAKKLSLWLTGGEDRAQLIRSQSSGGWKHRRLRHLGDLAPNGDIGFRFRQHFAPELKHHKEHDFFWIWTRGIKSDWAVQKWWSKLIDEIRTEKEKGMEESPAPMIIMRANNRPLLVGSFPDIMTAPFFLPENFPDHIGLTITYKGYPPLMFVEWDEFVEIDPEEYYERVEELGWSP